MSAAASSARPVLSRNAAIASQSTSGTPSMRTVAATCPDRPSANTSGGFPESLCVHRTLLCDGLTARPEDSVIRGSPTDRSTLTAGPDDDSTSAPARRRRITRGRRAAGAAARALASRVGARLHGPARRRGRRAGRAAVRRALVFASQRGDERDPRHPLLTVGASQGRRKVTSRVSPRAVTVVRAGWVRATTTPSRSTRKRGETRRSASSGVGASKTTRLAGPPTLSPSLVDAEGLRGVRRDHLQQVGQLGGPAHVPEVGEHERGLQRVAVAHRVPGIHHRVVADRDVDAGGDAAPSPGCGRAGRARCRSGPAARRCPAGSSPCAARLGRCS